MNVGLAEKGVDVTVYTTDLDIDESMPRSERVEVDGVDTFYFPCSFEPWEYSWGLHRKLAETAGDFDLIHITSTFLSASTLGAYYARRTDTPYIISPKGNLMVEPLAERSPLKKKLYLNLIEKKNLAGASAIQFTVPKEEREYLEAGLPLQDDILIPNGLNMEDLEADVEPGRFRKEHGIDEDTNMVLFLSRLVWKKGLDTLIPAFARVLQEEPDSTLVIAGSGEERFERELRQMVSALGLGDKVKFVGFIMDEEKVSAFQDADIFALTSYSENFGMVVVEAMHFGLPVVITENVGLSDPVKEAGAGKVIEKDAQQTTRAILDLLQNPKERKKMGQAGKKLVKGKFAMDKVADQWKKEYKRIIDKN